MIDRQEAERRAHRMWLAARAETVLTAIDMMTDAILQAVRETAEECACIAGPAGLNAMSAIRAAYGIKVE